MKALVINTYNQFQFSAIIPLWIIILNNTILVMGFENNIWSLSHKKQIGAVDHCDEL